MTQKKSRLRQAPVERFAGPEHRFELPRELGALRSEAHGARDGHRQIAIFRRGQLSLVLFAFEPGGRLAGHRARGFVVIQTLRGTIRVRTPNETHEIPTGTLLVLNPDVLHELESDGQADVLVTVSLESGLNGSRGNAS